VALDRITGTILWKTKLKGSSFINLACDDVFVYASTAGEAFCLDPTSGEIRWHNPLKGLGTGLAALLAPGGSPPQSVLVAEQAAREAQAAAAAAGSASANF